MTNAENRAVIAPLLIILAAALAAPSADAAAPKVASVKGQARSRAPDTVLWSPARPGQELLPGEEVETGPGSRLALETDGSKIDAAPGSAFVVRAASADAAALELGAGALDVSAAKDAEVRVELPWALCSARDAELRVSVEPGGLSRVDLRRGNALVTDRRGGEARLEAGQRLEAGAGGLGAPRSIEDAEQEARDKRLGSLRREVLLEMSREEARDAVSLEARAGVYRSR